jgi:hypothetical protein
MDITPNRKRHALIAGAAAGVMAPSAQANLIHLIPDGDFEGSRVRAGSLKQVDEYAGWNLSADQYLNARLAGPGALTAPMAGADGTFHGSWLAVYEQTRFDFTVPADAPAGPGNATLSFDYWSENNSLEKVVYSDLIDVATNQRTSLASLSTRRDQWLRADLSLSLVPGASYRLSLSKYVSFNTGWAGFDRVRLEMGSPLVGLTSASVVPEPSPGLLAMAGAWVIACLRGFRRRLEGSSS